MSQARFSIAGALRGGVSCVALAAAVLATGAAPVRSEEPRGPVVAGPQVAGLATLRERTSVVPMQPSRAHPARTIQAQGEADAEPGVSDDLKSAYACLLGGSVALAASFAVGGENLTNLIAGGVVVPQNQTVLYLALVGVVFAAFCSISESLLPIYTHHVEGAPTSPPARAPSAPAPAAFDIREASRVTVAPERVTFRAGVLGGAASGASRRLGATAFASRPLAPAEQPVLVAQER